jgi:hypothetical protein
MDNANEITKYCHGGCGHTPASEFTLDIDERYCDDCEELERRQMAAPVDWRNDAHAQHVGV